MSADNEKPEIDGEEVAKHTTRETGVWVIIHSMSLELVVEIPVDELPV